jgi:hypothetical protein
MTRTQALSLLLAAMLTLTHCPTPTPTPTPSAPTVTPTPTLTPTLTPSPTLAPTPDFGLYLLVQMKGSLNYKHPGWNDYLPLSFGTTLERGYLLRAESDAQGLVVCADLSLWTVPPDYDRGLDCPQDTPILMRGESRMVEPRRESAQTASIPYVLSPRHTFIQTEHPLLRWHPSATGTVTYTVQVRSHALDWQTETATFELPYPNDAPRLEPGESYNLTVVDPSNRSSEEEQAALDLSFVLLSREEIEAVQSLAEQARGLGLDERGTNFLLAEIYASHHLRAEAIALLEELAVEEEDAPTVYRRLGDLYLEVGLYSEAKGAYESALAGYCALGDRAGEASALVGLGLAHRGDGDDFTARDYLEKAMSTCQAIGDDKGTAQVQAMLDEQEGTR